jgi:tetratricopeptide (TPR) repeat protein
MVIPFWRSLLHKLAKVLYLVAGLFVVIVLVTWLLRALGFSLPAIIPDAALEPLAAIIGLIVSGLGFLASRLASQQRARVDSSTDPHRIEHQRSSSHSQHLDAPENLPGPTYSNFVPRPQPYHEVITGLQQRSPVVVIFGFAGNGKTSLAHEVATHCLQDHSGAPRFDAVVWVSDKEQPSTTNLRIVLDQIAYTLDYPGFTQYEHEEKLREVQQLLHRQKILLVIDNFESITDSELSAWLPRLPEPSKAIVTTREKHKSFWNSWLVELGGMSEAEAQMLISHRLRALHIEELISDLAQFKPLITATGGNPKAIELSLGLIKHAHRPLQKVVDDIYTAQGNLFKDLFAHTWALTNRSARRVLMALSLFPDSASSEALATTAGVEGPAFDQAIERLTELALLDEQRSSVVVKPRYTLHPLVRAFAEARLRDHYLFQTRARTRWISWYMQLASMVGWAWDDLQKLNLLDAEQESILYVINWTAQHQRDQDTLQLAKGIDHYYFVRGLWSNKLEVDRLRITAAARLGNPLEQCEAIALYTQLLCLQRKTSAVEPYLRQLEQFRAELSLPVDLLIKVQHSQVFYWIALKQFHAAQQILEQLLPYGAQASVNLKIANLHWLAFCYYQMKLIGEAERLFQEALSEARSKKHHRAILFHQRHLAEIDLDQGHLESAEKRLQECSETARFYQDRRHIAWAYRSYARLHLLRGNFPAATHALAEAIDLFERIGLPDDLAEAHAALVQLKSSKQSDTSAS